MNLLLTTDYFGKEVNWHISLGWIDVHLVKYRNLFPHFPLVCLMANSAICTHEDKIEELVTSIFSKAYYSFMSKPYIDHFFTY